MSTMRGELIGLVKRHYTNVSEGQIERDRDVMSSDIVHVNAAAGTVIGYRSLPSLCDRFQTGLSRSALGDARVHRGFWHGRSRRCVSWYKYRTNGWTMGIPSGHRQARCASFLRHLEGTQWEDRRESHLLWPTHILGSARVVDIPARGWSPRLRDFGFVLLLSSFFVIGKKEDDTTDNFSSIEGGKNWARGCTVKHVSLHWRTWHHGLRTMFRLLTPIYLPTKKLT